ncbi:MAG: AI-2E family transporter [Ruminococcaceae bacterium]|nr:AI-2E family transporter [Oscillospiraceae bacterium]
MSSFFQSKVLPAVLLGVIAWLALRFLLPLCLPLLLGMGLALAAEPLVSVCSRRLKLPRSAATGIGVTVTVLFLTAVPVSIGALVMDRLRSLVARLPDLGAAAGAGLQALEDWMLELAAQAPESLQPLARQGVDQLFASGDRIPEKLTDLAGSLASGIVMKIPDGALNIGTFLLAAFMFSARLPKIRHWLSRSHSEAWDKAKGLWRRLRRSVGGWLGAQAKLIAVTFGVLAPGFLLLRIENALLWAALIALADALPVLGTGVILVPWSIVCFIQGQNVRAVGLLGVCAVAVLLRSILEPKLVGKQLGLDPLVTLGAIYLGYRLWGLPGMLAAPLLAVTVKQLAAGRDPA